jgi:hypothetical protein
MTKATAADPFFDVPREVAQTSEGPVELPILYRRTRNINAFFLAERGRVEAALDAAGAGELRPTCEWRGKSLVALACFEYQDTSIGPYHEIGVAVAVVPRGVRPRIGHWLQMFADVDSDRREVGMYVLHLPVSTAAACAAGREIWGLPKFVTRFHYGRAGRSVEIELADPEHADDASHCIFALTGTLGGSLPVPAQSLLLYSHRQGQWLRTAVNVRGGARVYSGRNTQLRLGGSAHAMAGTLRALGLPGLRPLCLTDTDRFQSRLNAGHPIR